VDENGCGAAVLVVAPRFRSRGIATLLAERLAVESSEPLNWFCTGLKSLSLESAGPHPAAQRLAARMKVPIAAERSLLVRSLRAPVGRPELFGGPTVVVEVDELEPDQPDPRQEHTADLLSKHPQFATAVKVVRRRYSLPNDRSAEAIVRHSVFAEDKVSRLAFVEFVGDLEGASDTAIGAVIDAAASDLWAAGVKALLASVDARHESVVRAAQRRYFVHDQTDLTYVVELDGRRGGVG
jgi:mycothiol synthase